MASPSGQHVKLFRTKVLAAEYRMEVKVHHLGASEKTLKDTGDDKTLPTIQPRQTRPSESGARDLYMKPSASRRPSWRSWSTPRGPDCMMFAIHDSFSGSLPLVNERSREEGTSRFHGEDVRGRLVV